MYFVHLCSSMFPKDEREKINKDELHHHGGIKAMMGFTLLQAMTSLEQNFANVNTPYLMILGSEDKICNIDGSKVSEDFSCYKCRLYRLLVPGVPQNVRK